MDGITEILTYRINTYDFLRRVFLWEFPIELFYEMIEHAKEDHVVNSELSAEDGLQNFLQTITSEQVTKVFRNMGIEYTRLFIGPRRLPAPPYASVYTSPNKMMMQEETIDVRKMYLENGFRMLKLNQEPDDHVGAEMEFIFVMSTKAIEAMRHDNREELLKSIETQLNFLSNHLLKWIPNFCKDIMEDSTNLFWYNIAAFFQEFINVDVDNLNKMKLFFDGSER